MADLSVKRTVRDKQTRMDGLAARWGVEKKNWTSCSWNDPSVEILERADDAGVADEQKPSQRSALLFV